MQFTMHPSFSMTTSLKSTVWPFVWPTGRSRLKMGSGWVQDFFFSGRSSSWKHFEPCNRLFRFMCSPLSISGQSRWGRIIRVLLDDYLTSKFGFRSVVSGTCLKVEVSCILRIVDVCCLIGYRSVPYACYYSSGWALHSASLTSCTFSRFASTICANSKRRLPHVLFFGNLRSLDPASGFPTLRNSMKPFLNRTVSTRQFKVAYDKPSYSCRYASGIGYKQLVK